MIGENLSTKAKSTILYIVSAFFCSGYNCTRGLIMQTFC